MLHTWPIMISCPSLCPHVTFPSPLVSPDSSVGKESVCNAGDPGSIPGSGRYTREGIGYPLQYSWASLEAQLVKKPPGMQETWVGKIPWRRERLLTPVLWPGEFHGLYNPWGPKESDRTERLFFLDSSVGKESTCKAGDPSSIPRSGRFSGEEGIFPTQELNQSFLKCRWILYQLSY